MFLSGTLVSACSACESQSLKLQAICSRVLVTTYIAKRKKKKENLIAAK